jgi:hypothetical protein
VRIFLLGQLFDHLIAAAQKPNRDRFADRFNQLPIS